MISHGLKMLKRAIDERPKGGMQTGISKITIREADAVRAVAELEWAQSEIERLKNQLDSALLLIGAAVCPCCDKTGAYYDKYGEVCQCQWCDEVDKLREQSK